jgi:hypothetical protein
VSAARPAAQHVSPASTCFSIGSAFHGRTILLKGGLPESKHLEASSEGAR